MIDLDDSRLGIARQFGASATVNSADGKAADAVKALTSGRGVDTAIEAEILDAYDTFGNAAKTQALKVIIAA
jgi:Zn-dependent alcohol dehydrogenase